MAIAASRWSAAIGRATIILKLNRTALHVIGGRKTRISNCNFSTVNARAIYANTELAIENSNFTCCGHGDMDGGAVLLSNNSTEHH